MNHSILFAILLSVSVLVVRAQEAAPFKEESSEVTPAETRPAAETFPAEAKAILLIIDADAQQSEVLKQIVDALEKAGIATGKSSETAPPAESSISVTLGMRKDESYEKIRQLIEALRNAGVHQMSCRVGGVRAVEGGEEQNFLILTAHPGYTTDELHKIENAARDAANQAGLPLIVQSKIPEQAQGEYFESEEQKPDATQVKVFNLKFCEAESTATLLKELIVDDSFRAVADDRTNSVIVTGTAEQLQTVEALLLKLDESGPARAVSGVPIDIEAASLAKTFLQDELARLQLKYSPNHPMVRELEVRLEEARKAAAPASPSVASPPASGNLRALESLRDQERDLTAELQLEKENLDRMEQLANVGAFSQSELGQARLRLAQARSKLRAVENQCAAAKEQIKADLLQMMESSLDEWLRAGVIENSKISAAETRIPGIIAQVDPSPEEARKAAVEFADRLDKEAIKLLEAKYASIEAEIIAVVRGTPNADEAALKLRLSPLQRRLADLRRRQRARALLPGSTVPNGKFTDLHQPPFETLPEAESPGGDSVSELRRQYEQADQQAHTLASRLKENADPVKNEEIRKSVQRAFTSRQSLLRAELMEMQTRLLQTQRSIDMRERIADQIVDRRVEDLLNPQTRWEASQATPATEKPIHPLVQAFHRSMPSHMWTYLGMQISLEPVAATELTGTPFPIGFRMEAVTPGGLADTAGIQTGDILVSMAHPGLVSPPDLENPFGNRGPQRILAHVLRDGESIQCNIEIPGPKKE